jgi:hypothetical protein
MIPDKSGNPAMGGPLFYAEKNISERGCKKDLTRT